MTIARGLRSVRVVAALAALVVAPALIASADASGATINPGTGLSTNYDFARLVLRDGGWPQSASNVTVLLQWLRAEEPTAHWWNRDNPLNNGLGSGGGSGLGSYGSVVTAAYFVARNLENPAYGYPSIVRDFAHSAPAPVTAVAIWRSRWAAGHYGRGVGWATSPVDSVAAPQTVWRSASTCPISYPVGVVGPCGHGFSSEGSTWGSVSGHGIRGQEMWAPAVGRTRDTASWAAHLTAGNYAVAAFIPSSFADAHVVYAVADAKGAHRISIDQEPYGNEWAPLGVYASSGAGLSVVLRTGARDAQPGTYVAADAMRFVRTAAHLGSEPPRVAARIVPTRPGAPQNVAAIPADRSAAVTWLAPSKDGGAPVESYRVVARPSGHGCAARAPLWTCTVTGLGDGTDYSFVVEARNRVGVGRNSSPSSPVSPVGTPTLRVVARAAHQQFNTRVIYRAFVGSGAAGGTVLFAQDGVVLAGCQQARVIKGRASCGARFHSAGAHAILAVYSGDTVLAGAQASLATLVERVPTKFSAVPTPTVVVAGSTVTLRAWGLPGLATGRIVFSIGTARLCVVTAASGGGSCSATAHVAAGVHQVAAKYLGDRDFQPSMARTSLQVTTTTPPT